MSVNPRIHQDSKTTFAFVTTIQHLKRMEEFLNPSAGECRKNPGHAEFIPPSSFSPQHLPHRFQSLVVWALIRHKARLTVKLLVNFVSPDRPEEFRIYYSVRNTGSGYVTDIDTSDPDFEKITIDTAAHVVFDAAEAASTVAKFYLYREQEVFQLKGPAELLVVDHGEDLCRIMYTIDKETIQRLIPGNDFLALEYALRPSVLPAVNNDMNISLLQTVVARYQLRPCTWLSFLFQEIKCVKNIRFTSNRSLVLQIEICISPILLYDVIVLIIALKSHPDDILNIVGDIVSRNAIHGETDQRPFVTLLKQEHRNDGHIAESTSKMSLNRFIKMDEIQKCIIQTDFKKPHKEELYTLMICFITSPVRIAELNGALKKFCKFEISARFNESGNIVFELPETSVRVPGLMSWEVNLHDVRVEEEHDHATFLISHPHDMAMRITSGKLERLGSRGVEYTNPSCPGSSGGQVWVIPKEITSLEAIGDIAVFTHSYVSDITENGVGHRF